MLRNFQIPVVLQHTGKFDACIIAPVKLVKFLPVKRQRNFLCPIATEIKQNHAVAVGDFCYRYAIALNNKGR